MWIRKNDAGSHKIIYNIGNNQLLSTGLWIRIRIGSTLPILVRFKPLVLQFDSVDHADDILSRRYSLGQPNEMLSL
jgi:hypothetical protein